LQSWEEAYAQVKRGDTVWLRTKEYTGWAVSDGAWPQGDGIWIRLPDGRVLNPNYDQIYVKPI